jgi:hypothetical protein
VSKVDKNSKNSSKSKRSSKKIVPVSTSTVPVSSTSASQVEVQLAEVDQKRLQEILLHAQLEFNKIKVGMVKEKKKEIEALDQMIKEFIGPFMLIGYDLTNNPIEMVSASSPAEHDALLERLRRVMYKINQNIANTGGNDPYGFNSN